MSLENKYILLVTDIEDGYENDIVKGSLCSSLDEIVRMRKCIQNRFPDAEYKIYALTEVLVWKLKSL